ncbi:hypothetical protein ACFE04_021321 [Oxalis oulophora]
MGYIDVFDFTNRIDEAKLFLFDQTQCPVPCLLYHPPSPQLADLSPQVSAHPQDSTPASPHPQHSVDMSISGTLLIMDGESESDAGGYSFSQQLSFRLASDDKKFCIVKRPRNGSIVGFNSLRIPTVFVRRNIKYLEQPSRCVLKIPFVGQIESGLTWPHLEKSFRFLMGVYLEFLIEETDSDDGGIIFQVMVFNSNGTLCQPNVRGL